jgi:hypothetical protein
MNKRILSRVVGAALLGLVGGAALAGCQPAPPPPVPGQPLTWAQQHQIDLQVAQDMHDRRRQDRCSPRCRMN